MTRPARPLTSLITAFLLLGTIPATAQPIEDGVDFLLTTQAEDGSWSSTQVRRPLATTAVLRALQVTDRSLAARFAAADFLASEPTLDHDDQARRLIALTTEGHIVHALEADLVEGRDPQGGWGLLPDFTADPLDTALVLQALSQTLDSSDEVLVRGLFSLLFRQKQDGGFPCVEAGDGDADSRIFCTSHALLALSEFRAAFFLDQDVLEAADFLRSQLQPGGGFGPEGSRQVLHTALASLALATVPALDQEIPAIVSFLEAAQQPDGSWQGDPYVTAFVVRALVALSQVPFCGDGLINRAEETCDSLDLGGLTCEDVDLGPGTLACSAQCTLDTSGCTDPPSCGDNLRNQPFEVCDGTDLAGESCTSLDFDSGTLACAADCETFDVSGCHIEPFCGDGVINRTDELCDVSDLNGQTCEAMGLGNGLLQCANDCRFDTSLCDASSFTLDNAGREFFVGFLPNFDSGADTALHLTSRTPTTARIEFPVADPRFVRTVEVVPGEVTVVDLPVDTHVRWPAGRVRNNAVRVSAPEEIVVFLVNSRSTTTDAAMALPVDSLGTSHLITTHTDSSQFLMVAPFDDTTVTLEPATTMEVDGRRIGSRDSVQIHLARGEGFRGEAAFARFDLTGTRLEANRPIAVFQGNVCALVPAEVFACDHLFEMSHPIRSWGTSALVTNLPQRPGGSVYRVVASREDTKVTLDGELQAILDPGEFLEVGPLAGNHVFSADRPIFVTQFMTGDTSPGAIDGDPAMVTMIPPDQYATQYTFSTVGEQQFGSHFLTVTAPNSSVGAVRLDGEPISSGAFSPIGNSGFSSAIVPLAEGSHQTTSPEPHGITVEGLEVFDSYAYPGGSRVQVINTFCGDGAVNQPGEECDGGDFRGAGCTTFGFSTGFLQCTPECRVDTSQCSGLAIPDEDEDGFPATEDCDDRDPEIHPGMTEIFGNGVDDDCNPATPDEIPETTVRCELTSGQVSYVATDVIQLEARVENQHEEFSLPGLEALLQAVGSGQEVAFEKARELAPLPPGARTRLDFVFPAEAQPPGSYLAELTVAAGLDSIASCTTAFQIESSAETGAGLTGDLWLDPELVNAGEESEAIYWLTHQGNAVLADLAVRVLLVEPSTGEIVAEIGDTITLEPGGSFEASRALSTLGLESNTSYLAVLRARLHGAVDEQTLDNTRLTVVNAPPDCSTAMSDPAVLWPPNHEMAEVNVRGVTDPDDDPVSIALTGIFQDERTDDRGSGATCPDATGLGTPTARLRAERSGRQDGRVYHLFFTADDGRGGTCEGKVTICVPHDRREPACVDQGAELDATVCE